MNYEVFDGGDAMYLSWLAAHPHAFVLNTYRTKGSAFAKVHRATCSHISSTVGIPEGGFTTRADIKVGANAVEDFVDFLVTYKTIDGGGIAPCKSCRATTEVIPWHRPGTLSRKPWTREELLVLLTLYEKIPFGKFDQSNPVLIEVAACMLRTPGSVAMKLSNLASLDASLAARGIKGLTGASALDRQIWEEYHRQHEELAPQGEALLSDLLTGDADAIIEVTTDAIDVLRPPVGPTEMMVSAKARRGQSFFRQAVLNAYGSRCAVTGLSIRDLLVASHIIPWNAAEEHRLDPQNGIALNALHDKAFDRGLITFDTELRLVCSKALRDHFADATVSQHFKTYEGKPLAIPAEAAGPKAEYLEWHRNKYGFKT
ncbi:MAG: HNH endonuclease [Flavobacteriales bacterium]|nr:HNH endonuclease [Flavobacteriales bacterium]